MVDTRRELSLLSHHYERSREAHLHAVSRIEKAPLSGGKLGGGGLGAQRVNDLQQVTQLPSSSDTSLRLTDLSSLLPPHFLGSSELK